MQRNLDNFSFVENPYRKVICTNIKKNQLFEVSLCELWRSTHDDFRELHENEPEMAALGVETNYRYL